MTHIKVKSAILRQLLKILLDKHNIKYKTEFKTKCFYINSEIDKLPEAIKEIILSYKYRRYIRRVNEKDN